MTAIGLAVPARSIDDHFLVALIHALAEPLIQNGMSLVTKVVNDVAVEEQMYRHWANVGDIAGVAILGVRPDDSRVKLLRSLDVPIAAVVDARVDVDFPAVIVDFDASMSVLRTFLATRPHPRSVYITGFVDGASTLPRAIDIDSATTDDQFDVIRTENTVEAAVAAGMAAIANGPATLVFDSDVHAVAALAATRSRGLVVPDDVAIISWTNSALCQGASRSITAIDRRGSEIGALLGARMIAAIAGDKATRDRSPEPFVVMGETA